MGGLKALCCAGAILIQAVGAVAVTPVSAQSAINKGMPLSVKDRMAIQDLLNRYTHYVDSREAEAWASLFTPDGAFEFPSADGGMKSFKGRTELVEFVARVARRDAAEGEKRQLGTHFVGNTIMVQTAPGEVHARSMVLVGHQAPDPGAPVVFMGVGIYQDVIVKTKDGWRIKSRRAGQNGRTPIPAELLP